jgi:hypothetical protein
MSDAAVNPTLVVPRPRISSTAILAAAAATAAVSLLVVIWCLWPSDIAVRARAPVLEPVWTRQRLAVSAGGREIVAPVQDFENEFTAWLFYEYLRSRTFRRQELLLTRVPTEAGDVTRISVRLGPDLVAGIAQLAAWQAGGHIESSAWTALTEDTVNHWRRQTRIYQSAYSLPARKRLEEIPRPTLLEYMHRFIRFKSRTDPRTALGAAVPVLSSGEAQRLAGDMIAVAEFFDLPLDVLLGIGAMENNYMNVRGDLENTAWKRRAQAGDIVLRRARGRVLVLNDSAGVWQITRETLRYAHKLYKKDVRDYSQLPEHLRPPAELHLEEVSPAVLTTYAGLLLRDLIDRFDGDTAKAVGAYNGGPGNPNMRYEEGVRRIAAYARTLLERAASLHGQSIAEMKFVTRLKD